MTITDEYLELAQQVDDSIDLPRVSGIYLPKPVAEPSKPDEFGFIVLDDGSVGPFYVSLEDSLHEIWKLYPDRNSVGSKLMPLINLFERDSLAQRAVALGAFNAMSQHVMRLADFSPTDVSLEKGVKTPAAGDSIAVVGYIRPMIEKMLQDGVDHILVLEKNPDRVEPMEGVRVSTNPADLRAYNRILCTASTLVNDSLGEILRHARSSAYLCLVGPSGSGLPDVLFQHGVDEVGGFQVDDSEMLIKAVESQQSWGESGRKYRLGQSEYPGIEELLDSI